MDKSGNFSDVPGNYSNVTANDEFDYYYYYEDEPYTVAVPTRHIPALSIVLPLTGVLTILGNIVVIYIFCKQKLKTPTSVLLIELAISDSFVCLPIVVLYIYIYSLGNHKSYLLYEWCITHHVGYIVQQIFRSTSNWLTAMLGVQRYIAVSWPFRAQRICTVKMSILSFLVFIFGSVGIYINEAISIEITPHTINETLPEGCVRKIPLWYTESISNLRLSVMMYYIFNGFLTRLLPCFILLFTTITLLKNLCCLKPILGKSIQESYSSKSKLRRTNVLVLVILFCFLVAEMQDAVAFCIYSYEMAVDKPRSVLPEGIDDIWDIYGMVVTLLGYHCIFWIFFFMSSQFRTALKQALFVCSWKVSKEESVRVSLLRSSTRSGNSGMN